VREEEGEEEEEFLLPSPGGRRHALSIFSLLRNSSAEGCSKEACCFCMLSVCIPRAIVPGGTRLP
jgi:hypothetical protein